MLAVDTTCAFIFLIFPDDFFLHFYFFNLDILSLTVPGNCLQTDCKLYSHVYKASTRVV